VRAAAFHRKMQALQEARLVLQGLSLTPSEAARHGLDVNRDGRRRSAFELLAFPGVDMARLQAIWPGLGAMARPHAAQLEIDARYACYVDRQEADVVSLRKEAGIRIPPELDYGAIANLSTEVRERLQALRPATLAQAGRMEGMTPAALMRLLAHLKKLPEVGAA
jgi:tRNA uridine 5-carboxymethylaminomethyl modification enzyme